MSLRIKHLKIENSRNWSTAKVDETVKESLDEIKAIREGLKKDFQKNQRGLLCDFSRSSAAANDKSKSNSIETFRYCSDVL